MPAIPGVGPAGNPKKISRDAILITGGGILAAYLLWKASQPTAATPATPVIAGGTPSGPTGAVDNGTGVSAPASVVGQAGISLGPHGDAFPLTAAEKQQAWLGWLRLKGPNSLNPLVGPNKGLGGDAINGGGGNLTGTSPLRASAVTSGPLREVSGVTQISGASTGIFGSDPMAVTRPQPVTPIPPPPLGGGVLAWAQQRFSRPAAPDAPAAPAQESYTTPASVIGSRR